MIVEEHSHRNSEKVGDRGQVLLRAAFVRYLNPNIDGKFVCRFGKVDIRQEALYRGR
jgi:hypothetical protein